jgi:hypothetical protein
VTVSRLLVLRAGDEVRFGGGLRTVTALSGRMVHLVDVAGAESAVALADLFCDPGFAVVTPRARAPLPPQGLMDGLPEEVAESARWWERHIVEVITGVPGEAGSAAGRPGHAMGVGTLRQREIAKVAELRCLGHEVSLRTLQRCGATTRQTVSGGWSTAGSPGSRR